MELCIFHGIMHIFGRYAWNYAFFPERENGIMQMLFLCIIPWSYEWNYAFMYWNYALMHNSEKMHKSMHNSKRYAWNYEKYVRDNGIMYNFKQMHNSIHKFQCYAMVL